jgi:hypothetical protein
VGAKEKKGVYVFNNIFMAPKKKKKQKKQTTYKSNHVKFNLNFFRAHSVASRKYRIKQSTF